VCKIYNKHMKWKETVFYKTELNSNYVINKTKQSMDKLKTVVLLWTVYHLGLFSTTLFLKWLTLLIWDCASSWGVSNTVYLKMNVSIIKVYGFLSVCPFEWHKFTGFNQGTYAVNCKYHQQVIWTEKLPKQLFRDDKKMKLMYPYTVFRVKIQD